MVTKSLQSLSSLYITSCGIEGKSPETLRSYAETLKLFIQSVKHLRLPDDPGLFRPADVYEFLGHVGSTGVSAITQWRRQRETRAFFSWLLRHDYIESNPFMKVKNIKVPQKIVQPFTADDIQLLLSHCDAGTRKGARDQALILALLDTGLRASELANLELGIVDFARAADADQARQGEQAAVVRFGERARQALAALHPLVPRRRTRLLAADRRGRRHLNRSAMRTIFQRLGEECGIAKVHPHRFRHTSATWAIEQQAREIDVQRLLGHSTSAMLRRYTASYDAEKAAQATPRSARRSPRQRHPAA